MRSRNLLLFIGFLFGSVACRADSFALSGSGVDDTFSLPSSPLISASGSYGFTIDNVAVNESGIIAQLQLTFFSQALGGGLLLESASATDVNGFGNQLYRGANNHPTFVAGTFALSDLETYRLTITPTVPAPEPSTFLLLGIGMLLVLIRRRVSHACFWLGCHSPFQPSVFREQVTIRRQLLTTLSVLIVGLGATALPAHAQSPSGHWVGTWATAPDAAPIAATQPVGDITYREVVHISQGGQQVRVVFSNEFGTTPLNIASAHIAPSEGQSRIFTGDDHALTFSGRAEALIPAGERLASDPVSLKVAALSTLSVSFYLPAQDLPVLSLHHLAIQTNYVTQGNQVTAAVLPAAKEITTYPFLRTVEIQPTSSTNVIACLGDSITDGVHSTRNANARWPNVLANRLVDSESSSAPSVIDLGIGGNRLLQNDVGPDALARLDRDVLSQSNVSYLIVLEGINDIGDGWGPRSRDPHPPSTEDIIGAYKQIIARAHAHNIVVYGGTLLPYQCAKYHSTAGEAIREKVNSWIRTSGAFDGVLDFEKVVQDPNNPLKLSPAFDSGDSLHPNDAGYRAMGDSIPLSLFK